MHRTFIALALSRTLALAAAVLIVAMAACAPTQVSGGLLATYDSAVAAETVYLATGKATPAQATTLRALRTRAFAAVSAVVAAEKGGGNSAAIVAAAEAAVSAYLAYAQGVH